MRADLVLKIGFTPAPAEPIEQSHVAYPFTSPGLRTPPMAATSCAQRSRS
jgi:hypothetical protein